MRAAFQRVAGQLGLDQQPSFERITLEVLSAEEVQRQHVLAGMGDAAPSDRCVFTGTRVFPYPQVALDNCRNTICSYSNLFGVVNGGCLAKTVAGCVLRCVLPTVVLMPHCRFSSLVSSFVGVSRSDAAASTLDRLGLSYRAPWPLQLILTDEVMARYQVIFRFLLRLRLVQTRLGHVWAAQVWPAEWETRGKVRAYLILYIYITTLCFFSR